MDSNVSKKGATGTPVRKSRLPDLAGTGSVHGPRGVAKAKSRGTWIVGNKSLGNGA